MLGFIKKCFFTGLKFLSALTDINLLSCILMNNQECKVRPQIVNVNVDDPVFFPFSIKTSKCSGSCNNINNPLAKLCVPDVVKNLNVKVFNLVSGTNETRRIEWHKPVSVNIDLTVVFATINNVGMIDDKCECKCKELIDKNVCDKGFILNPSNCECKCYKSCDFSEYLDYKNCECKKRLGDKLAECSSAEECTENIEETRLAEIN